MTDNYDRFEDGERVCLRDDGDRPCRIGTVVKDTANRRLGVKWDPTPHPTEWTWSYEWERLDHYPGYPGEKT